MFSNKRTGKNSEKNIKDYQIWDCDFADKYDCS